MSILWTGMLVLALLSGHGAAQSCKTDLKGLGHNLAKGRPAFQSSMFLGMDCCMAINAVDGICYGDWRESSCTHTDWDWEPWWYVDLEGRYAISFVVVKNREDCCGHRIRGARIHVGSYLRAHGKVNPLCGTITDTRLGSISTINCNGLQGRYVSIIIPNRKEYLHICEVEVYGTKV